MHFDLVKIFEQMDLFAKSVVAVLLILGLASAVVFLERVWAFLVIRRADRKLAQAAAELLARHEYTALLARAEKAKGSALGALVTAGLRSYLGALRRPGKLSPVEAAQREMQRRADMTAAELRRGMSVLASTGSVAPFVGLLGTVVGIIAAFQGIAREGSGGLGAVSAGIAEALVVTALGLVIAIPSVLCFNFLSNRADHIVLLIDQSRSELVDHLEARGDPDNSKAKRRDEADAA